jgi:hypothetical protein
MFAEARAFAQLIGVEFKSDSVASDLDGHPVPLRIEETGCVEVLTTKHLQFLA